MGTLLLIVMGNFSIHLSLCNFLFYFVAISRAELNFAAEIRNYIGNCLKCLHLNILQSYRE